MRKFLASLLTLIFTVTFSATAVYAAPPKLEDLTIVIENALKVAVSFTSFVAVAMIIFAGYTYMTSQGDPQKVQRAQGTLTWAVIAIIFLAITGTLLVALFDFIGI